MTAKSLRALAKDYANGVLDKDSYRKARDAYFEAVLSGQIQVSVNEYRVLVVGHDLDSTFDKTAIISVAPPPREAPRTTEFAPPDLPFEPVAKKKSVLPASLLAGAIAISVIIIAILVAAMIFKPDPASDKTTAEIPGLAQDGMDTGAVSAEGLIEEFLKYNDWSDVSLQQLSAKWGSLNPEEQDRGLSTPLMTRFSNAIYRQLVEERARTDNGDNARIMARQHALVDFAAAFGILDPRLVVREVEVNTPVSESSDNLTSPE